MVDFDLSASATDTSSDEAMADGGGTETFDSIDYELSENVVDDLVKYTRSKTVRNEQQFLLTTLSYLSGKMEDPGHFVSSVLIGTAGSGKSHLQNTVESLFPDSYLYKATSGTDKSMIYDDDLQEARFASLDELQKVAEELIEILKSLHGGEDEEFRYKITGDGMGADRDVEEIVMDAIPYNFLYAQYDPDFEMWDRLLKIPVHESKDKNEGVARTQWDHTVVQFEGEGHDYMYDFSEGKRALQEYIRTIPEDARVKIPAGESQFGWDAFEYAKTLFDINRSETNRVSGQVANLVRASALLNHSNREKKEMHIPNEGYKEDVIIAERQDLANILACREVLLATTHQLDRKRKAICLAINEVGGTSQQAPIKHPKDREGQPKSIMGYLRQTNASFVKRPQIEAMLGDLQDNGLVEKLEGAGNNGRNLYQFQSWQSLGKFNIDTDFKNDFADCHDPFEDRSFIETARELNATLTPDASEFVGEDTVSSTSSDGQVTLGGDDEPDLAPHEERVAAMLKETVDGAVIENLDEHEPTPRELVGLVPLGADDDALDSIEGTVLDPSHEVWTHGPEDWVNSESDAETEIENALRTLTNEGVFKTSVLEQRGGQPLTMEITVADL
jgi:hypothetical protein